MVCSQYNDTRYFVNGAFYGVPYVWQDVWRRTFRLDTVIGLPQHTSTAQRVVAIVPAEKLLGCAPTTEWIFASPQPCRGFWLVQPTHTLTQLHLLRARVASSRSLATSVIVVCPTHSTVHLGLQQWSNTAPWQCITIARGPMPQVPFLRSEQDACLPDTEVAVYWIVDGQDGHVYINDVVSNMDPFVRKTTWFSTIRAQTTVCHPYLNLPYVDSSGTNGKSSPRKHDTHRDG